MTETPPESSPPSSRGLSADDARLIELWGRSLRDQGWTHSSAVRAMQRVRGLARCAPAGLLRVTELDVLNFAGRAARRRHLDLDRLSRSPGWRRMFDAVASFYAFAFPGQDPLRGLRGLRLSLLPGHRRLPRPGLIRRYDELLHHPAPSPRARALIWLAAHGLTTAELTHLQTDNVNLQERLVRVADPRRRMRVVPFTRCAADVLAPWIRQQQSLGVSWLFGSNPAKPPSTTILRDVARRAVCLAFRHPAQRSVRDQLTLAGLRDVFLLRAMKRRVAILDARQKRQGCARQK